jgi:hypothetical protein
MKKQAENTMISTREVEQKQAEKTRIEQTPG